METGIIIAIITGVFALALALLNFIERRIDKRSDRLGKEKDAMLEKVRLESANIMKKISEDLEKQWQQRVTDLEEEVTQLKKRVILLETELSAAYQEIERLKKARIPRARTTT